VTGLQDRWPLPDGHDVRDALLAAYADPARGYHDTLHLTEVLDRLDELAAAGEPFDAVPVRLAAWFHDGVYDGEPGAEERSAQWAEQTVGDPEVARLVRLTEHHRPVDGDRNGMALSDADLAILAADDERYADYVATVRREYADVPDADFAVGRALVLRDLLAKPTLFQTRHGRAAWEARARANVLAELSGL
jgi:predicted metal-dependent HD superfamily phosphohydrolase